MYAYVIDSMSASPANEAIIGRLIARPAFWRAIDLMRCESDVRSMEICKFLSDKGVEIEQEVLDMLESHQKNHRCLSNGVRVRREIPAFLLDDVTSSES